MTLARCAVLGLLFVAQACSHTTTIRSDPPGADVFIEAPGNAEQLVYLGVTPYALQTNAVGPPWGDAAVVVVADDENGVRFSLQRGRVTWQSLLGASCGACTTMSLCGALAVIAGGAGWALIPVAPYLVLPGWCAAGCLGLVTAAQPALCGLNMWTTADEVYVVMGRRVTSEPPELTRDEQPVPTPPRDVPRQRPDRRPPPGGETLEVRVLQPAEAQLY